MDCEPSVEASSSKSLKIDDDEPERKKIKLEHDAEHEAKHENDKSDSQILINVESSGKPGANLSEVSEKGDGKDTSSHGLVTEQQVGLSEYLGGHSGFCAVIKQRYSDFIVNEIDQEGNTVHLTDCCYNELDEEKDDSNETEASEQGENTESVLSEDDENKMKELAENVDKVGELNILAPDDKDLRTKIHLTVKKRFKQFETKTTEDDQGRKVIQVFWRKGKAKDFRRDEWPKTKKSCRYVRFVLYKENKDTMDAIGLIAKNLKVKESMFQYAGTKDKRGKTSQEVTAHRIHPKKLSCLNKVLWNMGLGNFRYVQEPMKLGQLKGNHFIIVLRNVQGEKENIEDALMSLKSKGFINYYGMQRFGTSSIPTYSVGRALLHEEWDKAVNLILMPREDKASKVEFQKVWEETHDASATLKVIPRYCGLERNLLQALSRNLKPMEALERISRNTRLMYVHSYQSLIWNHMVSKRLKELGTKPVVGDLVIKKDSPDNDLQPEVITSDNLEQYSLDDVVLPLPGHDVLYPQNQVKSWYRDQLAADNLDIDNLKRSQKDYSLPGAYRHIIVHPSDVTWSHHQYDDYTEPLTLSDFDRIKEKEISGSTNEGKYAALVLSLTLPTSCYATMALRELMKTDTSVAHQTSLNVT